MQVSFENDYGKITIGGGSHPVWNATEITGIGLPSKSYNTVTYADKDGQRTISHITNARTITIGGDVKNSGSLQRELTKAVKVLFNSGVSKIRSGNKMRKIECRCVSFDTEKRNGAAQLFVMQFICDNPYFSDYIASVSSVYELTNKIDNEFTFPMVFTNRANENDVINYGDIKTVPVFTIKDITADAPLSADVLDIYNATTGQHIKLNYSTAAGEEIVIDLQGRKITSSLNGSILSCITPDTYLNDFWLDAGINHIVVYSGKNIYSKMEYSNLYAEAIY
jgi:phage-related protein